MCDAVLVHRITKSLTQGGTQVVFIKNNIIDKSLFCSVQALFERIVKFGWPGEGEALTYKTIKPHKAPYSWGLQHSKTKIYSHSYLKYFLKIPNIMNKLTTLLKIIIAKIAKF